MTAREIPADTQVAIALGGRCLVGRTAEVFDGRAGSNVSVRFHGQPYLFQEARDCVFTAREARVGPDGSLLPPMSFGAAMTVVLSAAERAVGLAAGADHWTRMAVQTAKDLLKLRGEEIDDDWQPALASPPAGWPTKVTEASDQDDTEEPLGALRVILSLTQGMIGNDGAVAAAERRGARLSFRDDNPGAESWIVLDQPGTPMWDRAYPTRDEAARAFCFHHGIPLEPSVPRLGWLDARTTEQACDLVRELIVTRGDELEAVRSPAPR
jgi:hypothetical protein